MPTLIEQLESLRTKATSYREEALRGEERAKQMDAQMKECTAKLLELGINGPSDIEAKEKQAQQLLDKAAAIIADAEEALTNLNGTITTPATL